LTIILKIHIPIPTKENGMGSLDPLSQFPPGSRVRVETLCDCPKARGRLCAMGITPGTVVEITSGCGGPVCLRARGVCVTLGHGLAGKVYGRLTQETIQAA
jgi:ferrous iron transport protein A